MRCARRLPAVRLLTVALVALGALALAGPAVAAKPAIGSPDDNALVDTVRPTFTWSHNGRTDGGQPGGFTTGYEVRVEGVGLVATLSRAGLTPAQQIGPFSAPSTVDLPDDSTLVWTVTSIGQGGGAETSDKATFRISTPPTTPPTIVSGPGGPTNQAGPLFAWAGTRVASTWTLLSGATPVGGADVATGGGRVQLGGLADGAYTFRVVQRTSQGQETPAATRAFTVDTLVPAILQITAVPSFPTLNASPTFAWAGTEPGAKVTWQVIGVGGNTVRGPVDTLAGSSKVGPLPPGSFLFQVRQTDTAGNPSDWRSEPFAVAPGATVAGRPRLPTRNAKSLRPKVGARVLTSRPVLRWKRTKRARLYNLQIFRVGNAGKLSKVRSTFPRTNRFRPSRKRKLAPGTCYVWRVWPYIGKRFTKQPLGVSHFCVARPRSK